MSEIESKQALPRSEIAEYLREFANELETVASESTASGDGAESTGQRTDADAPSGAGGGDAIGTTKRTESTKSPDDPAGTSTADVDDDSEETESVPDDRVTFVVGDESATVKPPETPLFEIEVESDSSLVGSGEQQSVSFELEWEVDELDDDSRIEIK